MKWVDDFDLFLFDLDGLLVNTEILHYQAYIEMLKRRGSHLNWSFSKFLEIAHFDGDSLKNGIYFDFPTLLKKEPNFNILREEKNLIFLDILKASKIDFLPGVLSLLETLDKKDLKRCVVTNSSKKMTDLIILKCPELKNIPNWVTREDYLNPKPSSDSYLKAIEMFSLQEDRIIGFEDSLRGIRALQQTKAVSVLISDRTDLKKDIVLKNSDYYFKSFEDILKSLL